MIARLVRTGFPAAQAFGSLLPFATAQISRLKRPLGAMLSRLALALVLTVVASVLAPILAAGADTPAIKHANL